MKYLSGKDKKKLIQDIGEYYSINKKDEIIEFENILFKNKEPFLIDGKSLKNYSSNLKVEYIPHLKSYEISNLKKVTIDVGAVPFLLKGADMMRPGVVHIDDEIELNELLVIVDEVKGLKIGIGQSMYSSQDMKSMQSGKVIKTLHYFKDSLYDISL